MHFHHVWMSQQHHLRYGGGHPMTELEWWFVGALSLVVLVVLGLVGRAAWTDLKSTD